MNDNIEKRAWVGALLGLATAGMGGYGLLKQYDKYKGELKHPQTPRAAGMAGMGGPLSSFSNVGVPKTSLTGSGLTPMSGEDKGGISVMGSATQILDEFRDRALAFDWGAEQFCKAAGFDAEDTEIMMALLKEAMPRGVRATGSAAAGRGQGAKQTAAKPMPPVVGTRAATTPKGPPAAEKPVVGEVAKSPGEVGKVVDPAAEAKAKADRAAKYYATLEGPRVGGLGTPAVTAPATPAVTAPGAATPPLEEQVRNPGRPMTQKTLKGLQKARDIHAGRVSGRTQGGGMKSLQRQGMTRAQREAAKPTPAAETPKAPASGSTSATLPYPHATAAPAATPKPAPATPPAAPEAPATETSYWARIQNAVDALRGRVKQIPASSVPLVPATPPVTPATPPVTPAAPPVAPAAPPVAPAAPPTAAGKPARGGKGKGKTAKTPPAEAAPPATTPAPVAPVAPAITQAPATAPAPTTEAPATTGGSIWNTPVGERLANWYGNMPAWKQLAIGLPAGYLGYQALTEGGTYGPKEWFNPEARDEHAHTREMNRLRRKIELDRKRMEAGVAPEGGGTAAGGKFRDPWFTPVQITSIPLTDAILKNIGNPNANYLAQMPIFGGANDPMLGANLETTLNQHRADQYKTLINSVANQMRSRNMDPSQAPKVVMDWANQANEFQRRIGA